MKPINTNSGAVPNSYSVTASVAVCASSLPANSQLSRISAVPTKDTTSSEVEMCMPE